MGGSRALAILVAGALGFAPPAAAQTASPPVTQPSAAASAGATSQAAPTVPPPVLEPEALDALKRVQAFLQTINAVEIKADVMTEEVYNSGQKIIFGQRLTYRMQRPNKVRLDFQSDLIARRIYFDGSQVTVSEPRLGFYAQTNATGTIKQFFEAAAARGIELPLEDLLLWADPAFNFVPPASGFYVGAAIVGREHTDHYAFRKPGLDFQIWIKEGDQPLPLKIVITDTTDPAQPSYIARLEWDLVPRFTDSEFRFVPGPNDRQIPFQPRGTAATAAAKSKE
jgi:hypothetical protein